MELIRNLPELNKAIARIKTAGKKLDDTIQLVGLSCLQYAEDHGQVTPASDLFKALPKGARRNALAEWMVAYGKITVKTTAEIQQWAAEKGKDKAEAPVFNYAKDKATDLAEAEAKPWYEFRPERPVQEVFDAQQAAQALLKRIQRAKTQAAEGTLKLEHEKEAADTCLMILDALGYDVKAE